MYTTQMLQNLLKEQAYVPVSFPLGKADFDQAIETFFAFLKEQEHVKKHISFTVSQKHRRGDIGFVHRDPKDHMYNDSKDFFHFHPAIFRHYGTFIQEHPVVRSFLEAALPIWDATRKTVHTLLSVLEEAYPGTISRVFGGMGEEHIMVRFLKYNWQKSGKYLAKPHFDAGSFTLAMAESTPGLRIGAAPDDLKPVTHAEHQALFMLSSNVDKAFGTSTDLPPGWHDVVQLNDKMIGQPLARWAIVAFIDAKEVETVSRDETHKWYQPTQEAV